MDLISFIRFMVNEGTDGQTISVFQPQEAAERRTADNKSPEKE